MTRYAHLALAALLAGAGACSNIIGVEESPSRVVATEVETPANAGLLVDGAVGNFECAFSHYITGTSLLLEELDWASTSPWGKEYDRRTFSPSEGFYATQTCDSGSGLGIYKPLSTARWQADNTLRLLEGWTDAEVANRQRLIATAAAYSGYAHVLLGEGMCTAAVDLSPELTPAQVFALAEERFTTALAAAQAAGRADLANLALVGRARARLNLGRAANAADDARLVPEGFVFYATYALTPFRRRNFVYDWINVGEGVVVGPAFRNVRYRLSPTDTGVRDPRIKVQSLGRTAEDRTTPLWVQTKYANRADSIPLASGREAMLIVAEAELGPNAVVTINKLHTKAGLPLFASTDNAQIMQQIIYERRAEFFLESQALGDVRRLNLPLSPAAGTNYPGGGVYGGSTCFPLPDNERSNNPNI